MSPLLGIPAHEQFEEAYEWPKECLLGVDVVVEHPGPVFEVAEKALHGAPQPEGLVDVVVEPGSDHCLTVP